jgi:hypothetical protein
MRASVCRAWLSHNGWPLPLSADSGNGGHLLYRLALPNDEVSRQVLQRCLKALAERFSDDAVKVDTGTFNAARIWKLYGTFACKGDPLPDRPHRLTRILEAPAPLVVPQAQLDALAALAVSPATAYRTPGQPAPVFLDDQTLLARMFAARNGAAVRRLWDGDASGYPSSSEADLALCRHLAFWTGGDASRIDALFRQSGLYREDKWHDRDDYRQRTITKALEWHEFYRPVARSGDHDSWLGPRGARAGIPLTVRRA